MLPHLAFAARHGRCGLLPAAVAAAAAASGASLRAASTAGGPAGVVDQMIAYARKEGGSAAVDVLRSGLAMQPDPAAGLDAARLLVALSELSGAQADWAASATHASQAAAAAVGGSDPQQAAQLGLAARLLQVRALLAAGSDADAATAAAAAAGAPSVGAAHPLPGALQLLAGLSAGQGPASAPAAPETSGGDVLQAAASKLTADAMFLAGRREEAEVAYQQAAGAAAAAAGAAESGGDAGPLSLRFAREVEADASLGLAQVSMAAKQWDAAEERLSAALKAAEAAGGETAPLLAPVLCTLGVVYSRSARVMYAEGMFREAAKLAKLDPGRLSVAPPSHALHPSAHAALAWRHCQLLTALPNRAGEATTWEAAARDLWAHAGGGCSGAAIEGVLGDKAALKGQGSHGGGWVATLLPRRLLVLGGAS